MPHDLLPRIRDLSGLQDLFLQLGYERADAPSFGGGRVIAQWHGFQVVATTSTTPRDAVRALARRLTTAGERAVAVVLGSGELAIAAPQLGTGVTTKLLIVSLRHPTRLALEQLQALGPGRATTALAHAIAVAETLSTEVAGNRFFQEFRTTLERMAAGLDGRRSLADRRMVVLLALTRVLFLYFVQAKGWLDGRPDYLRSLLESALHERRDFHRTALDPLFFGTLNAPPAKRVTGRAAGQIPYLNGGLFERHPLELRLGSMHMSNKLWQLAFERLFDRFHFCIREADEVDAIAPDMLGRVFERLMQSDERARTGTFYTPENVVRDLVKVTIATALHDMNGLTHAAAARLVDGGPLTPAERAAAEPALRRLRLLDPAAGSGAFLLGALDLLTDCAVTVAPVSGQRHRWQVRRRILRENLFGVDVNPVAVRLAELRLWLAVVADDPTTDIASVAPLPNLDGVVRQGNTLLDPVSTARMRDANVDAAIRRAHGEVQRARVHVFDARGEDGHLAIAALRDSERKLALAVLEQAAGSADRRLQEFRALSSARNLFGDVSGLTPTQRSECRAVRSNRLALKRALSALRDGSLPFFSFEVHVPDVMQDGGFHVVVGNPPWVRAERLSTGERSMLRQRFSWWQGGRRRGFRHLPDLALAFLQRALELTASGGAVGFLLPSKIASADYGDTARLHLVRETTISYLHRVSDDDAARFGATTYPLALVVRNQPPPSTHTVHLDLKRTASVTQSSLAGRGPWILVPDHTRDALRQFRESGPPIRSVAAPGLGVKTGADTVLVGTLKHDGGATVRVKFGDAEIQIERTIIRRALRGRDVLPFAAMPGRIIIWGYAAYGRLLDRLPPRAASYVERHRTRLLQRADYRGGAPWILFRTRAATAPHRMVWRDIARFPTAVLLDATHAQDAVPINSCYVAPFPDRQSGLAATAVTNSSWSAALATVLADEARGGYRRFNARVIGALPTVTSAASRSQLVDLSTDAHDSNSLSQRDLDDAVAQALALSQSVQSRLSSLVRHHPR